ncbi:hypothetical protein NQZ68_022649 [Dissostichus eleginoides]|nr:hypothetical protein NQZ68_022649 [Dissostichus eleginoides]
MMLKDVSCVLLLLVLLFEALQAVFGQSGRQGSAAQRLKVELLKPMHEVKVRSSPMILHSQWLKYTSHAVFGSRSEPRVQRAEAVMDYSSQIPELCRTKSVVRRTQTDGEGERGRVCLFFLSFVYLDDSDLSPPKPTDCDPVYLNDLYSILKKDNWTLL